MSGLKGCESSVSSAKPKAKSSVNRQVKAAINAVRDFIAGKSGEARVADSEDKALRQVVAAELLATMSGDTAKISGSAAPNKSSGKTSRDAETKAEQELYAEQEFVKQEQERARQLFLDHGYLEEAVQDLRAASSPAERAAAARTLGIVGSGLGNVHLIAALFDDAQEVREAAAEALSQLGDPAVANTPIAGADSNILSANSETPEVAEPFHLAPGANIDEPASATFLAETDAMGKENESESRESESFPAKTIARDPSGRFVRASSKAVEPASSDSEPSSAGANGEDRSAPTMSTTLDFNLNGQGEQPSVFATPPPDTDMDAEVDYFSEHDTPDELLDSESSFEAVSSRFEEVVVNAPTQELLAEFAKSLSEEVHLPQTIQEVFVAVQPGIIDDQAAAREVDQLLLEEDAVRKAVEALERQLLATEAVRKDSEKEALIRIDQEAKLRAEAEARRLDAEAQRLEAERLRQRAEEDAELRRFQEHEAVMAEQTSRLKAEAEAHRLAEEESRLRLDAAGLRLAAEELARQRTAIETARREAAEAARHAEATRAREEAEASHRVEVERLRREEEALRTALEEVALRRTQVEAARYEAETEIAQLTEERAQLAATEAARATEANRMRREAEDKNRIDQEQLRLQLEGLRKVSDEVMSRRTEVDIAREKADQDSQRLAEAQARMRSAEEARQHAEMERQQLEVELHQRRETEQRLLDETRRRAQEEQKRLHEDTRRRTEEEERRLAELEVLRAKAAADARQRAEKEQQLLTQIESLRIADAEARKRIEDAEVRRRTAEETTRLAAEKVQRVETEAHNRAMEEEQILAKLEAVRRSAAVDAQGRAEQEKRIKEEIEMFRRLEEEERPRVEAAILQRTNAEARLQQERDRVRSEGDARFRAEDQLNQIVERGVSEETNGHERATETLESAIASATDQMPEASVEQVAAVQADASRGQEPIHLDRGADSGMTPAVVTYLNSVDPYKRAAAVGELARSRAKDAFALITNCFDDHSPHVRNAAARALCQLEPGRTVDLFNQALEEASEQRRGNIGSAIANSGLATEAIDNLDGESREETYNALCILFVMAKTGEIQPLVEAIERHADAEVRRAAIKLLNLSGQAEAAELAVKRRLK